MAAELSAFARLSLNKVGFTPSSGDITVSLDSADPDGTVSTQDLTADTSEALALDDVGLPCAAIMVKVITPVSGSGIELSLQTGGSFDANRFAVMTKQNQFTLWTPKLGTTIYVKSVGAAGRIAIVAG
jgi:hypothetical protein